MDLHKRIDLTETRDFSSIFSATFELVVQNWRVLLKAFFVFVGPFVLVAGFLSSFFQADIFTLIFSDMAGSMMEETDFFDTSVAGGYVVAMFLSFAALVVTMFLFYAFLLVYRDAGPGTFDLPELWAKLKQIFFPLLGLILLMSLVIVLVALVNIVPCLGQIAFVVAVFYLMVPFSIAPMVLLNERLGYIDALKRSFELVKGYWWQTFGIVFVFAIVVAVFSSAISLPGYLAVFAIGWLSAGDGGLLFRVIIIITSIIEQFGLIFYGLSVVAVSLQYFNLLERKEGLALMQRIEGLSEHQEGPEGYPEP